MKLTANVSTTGPSPRDLAARIAERLRLALERELQTEHSLAKPAGSADNEAALQRALRATRQS